MSENTQQPAFINNFDRRTVETVTKTTRFIRKALEMPDFSQAISDVLGLKQLGLEEKEAVLDVLYRLARSYPHITPSVLGAEFKIALQKEGISVQ